MLHYMIHDLVLLEMKMLKIRINYHVENLVYLKKIAIRVRIITKIIL